MTSTYVKVSGYIEIPDEHVDIKHRSGVTREGYAEIQTVQVGDLDDLQVQRDDRV